jgi:hypothetical protein
MLFEGDKYYTKGTETLGDIKGYMSLTYINLILARDLSILRI